MFFSMGIPLSQILALPGLMDLVDLMPSHSSPSLVFEEPLLLAGSIARLPGSCCKAAWEEYCSCGEASPGTPLPMQARSNSQEALRYCQPAAGLPPFSPKLNHMEQSGMAVRKRFACYLCSSTPRILLPV